MSQILITKKKYNFRIGHNIKVGKTFYQIIGIEFINHPELVSSVGAGLSADQSFQNQLSPSKGNMYWIESIGIDGALGFQLKFPSVPRWTVHGNKRFVYRHTASYTNPLYFPFLVREGYYPQFTFHNPEATAKLGVLYLGGERWFVDILEELDKKEIAAAEGGRFIFTDLTSYSDLHIGEG